MSRRTPALADAAVPLVVAAVIAFGSVAHSGHARVLPLVLGVGAGLALFGRRHAPAATLAVTGSLVVVLLQVSSRTGATAILAPAVALYSLALRRGVLARTIAALTAVVAILVAELLQDTGPNLLQTVGHVLLVAIPLLIADVHRTRHANAELRKERLALAERSREQELERRAQTERLSIARDLHDVIAHTLTTINVQASTAGELLDRRPEHARGALAIIEDASRHAIDEVRAILGVLRGGDGSEPPLTPAPGIEDLPELVQRNRADAVDVVLETTGHRPGRIPDSVSLAAYRIVQESLTNARRHAEGTPVRVAVGFERGLVRLTVTSGAGSSPMANGDGAGVGILGMTERAATVGGTLSAERLPEGFRVEARLPCGAA